MTNLTLNTCLTRDPDLVCAEMDGDLVMMSIENGEYYGIGGVGTRIWELLDQPTTIQQLVETIKSEFDIEEDRCRDDVLSFSEKLFELGLIKPTA
jgi:hypothetical protein